jgi:hypothetical protein
VDPRAYFRTSPETLWRDRLECRNGRRISSPPLSAVGCVCKGTGTFPHARHALTVVGRFAECVTAAAAARSQD